MIYFWYVIDQCIDCFLSFFFYFSSEESSKKLSEDKIQLTHTVNELQSEMAAVHAKESELLDYIKKMTAKCTQLQSTVSVIQAQVRLILQT